MQSYFFICRIFRLVLISIGIRAILIRCNGLCCLDGKFQIFLDAHNCLWFLTLDMEDVDWKKSWRMLLSKGFRKLKLLRDQKSYLLKSVWLCLFNNLDEFSKTKEVMSKWVGTHLKFHSFNHKEKKTLGKKQGKLFSLRVQHLQVSLDHASLIVELVIVLLYVPITLEDQFTKETKVRQNLQLIVRVSTLNNLTIHQMMKYKLLLLLLQWKKVISVMMNLYWMILRIWLRRSCVL